MQSVGLKCIFNWHFFLSGCVSCVHWDKNVSDYFCECCRFTCLVCRDRPRCSQTYRLTWENLHNWEEMGRRCVWLSPGERWSRFHLLSYQPASHRLKLFLSFSNATWKQKQKWNVRTFRLRPANSRTCLASWQALVRPSICSWSLISM